MQTFCLQALQSKALYGGKGVCKPKGTKALLWFAKLRANLWFASLTKQSFVWRQNFVLQAIQKTPCKAYRRMVPKQSFGSQNFVQTFGLQAGRRQNFASHTKLCFVRRLQALQSKALYGVCKPYKAKLCKSFATRLLCTILHLLYCSPILNQQYKRCKLCKGGLQTPYKALQALLCLYKISLCKLCMACEPKLCFGTLRLAAFGEAFCTPRQFDGYKAISFKVFRA